MLGIDTVMPTDEEIVLFEKTPQGAWTQKLVLTEPQDIFSSTTHNDSEIELCSNRDAEKENSFVGLKDMNRTIVVDDVEPSVDLQVEEEEDRDGIAVENHHFEEESTENTEAPVYLDAKKDYCDFLSLQKLLKAIFLHRSIKVRAIARIPRTLPTPPQFWQPGKFALPTNTSVPAELVGTMSRALVHVPSPVDLTPIVNIDISNNAISVYTSTSDKDFSDLYYHTLQYNEQTGEDFDIPLSQFLGEILQDYRREKRKRRIEETQLLAGSDHLVEVSTARSKLIRKKKSPLRRLADWLKHSLPFGL